MADDDQLTHDLASLRIARDDEPRMGSASAGNLPTRIRRGRSLARAVPWILVILLLVGVATAGVVSGGAQQIKERIVAPEVKLAQVSLISASQADVTLVATGYVVSHRKATLAPKLAGRVAHLFADEGSRVRQNQIVAELERTDAEAQLAQAHADVASAHAKGAQVKADLADSTNKAKREANLLSRGAGTPASAQDTAARVDVFRAQLAAANAEEAALKTRIRTVAVQIENSRVRAPFDGTVLRKLAEVGEVVSPTPAGGVGGIFLVADLDHLEVEADVAESQLYKIMTLPDAASGRGGVGSPAEIILDAFPDRRFRGSVSDIRPTVDRAKATVTVKVRFIDATQGVLPDMGAKVSFLVRPLDVAALAQAPKRVVPSDAIVDRDGARVVLVLDGERIKTVVVKVQGPAGAGQTEILDGPPPGAQVVRAPSPQLRSGMKVKPSEG